jgi:hypothetical protein
MGSSTVSLQSVVDLMKTMGSLSVQQATGGYSQLTWLAIATDVVNDLISQKFNWKWNQFKIPPFWTVSYQCDYATVGQKGIGWVESGTWTDINNTSLPKPRWPIEAVRGLQPTSQAASPPKKVCWFSNKVLEQGSWPGPAKPYIKPLGATGTPQNPPTNINDAHGNILILTTFGITGGVAPDAGANPVFGATINDGTCIWTVADPDAQGFRVIPMPPMSGVVYQLDLLGQANPPAFVTLDQKIDPIPDDYSGTFRAGVYVYCHKYAVDPNVKRMFPLLKADWIADIMGALKQGDREADDAGFIPDRNVMGNGYAGDVGPANPYGSGWPWNGGR